MADNEAKYQDLFGGESDDEEPPPGDAEAEADADAEDDVTAHRNDFKSKLEEQAKRKREQAAAEAARQASEKNELEDDIEDADAQPGPSKRQRVEPGAEEGAPPGDYVAPENDDDRAFIDDTDDAVGAAAYKDVPDDGGQGADQEADEAEEGEEEDEVEAYLAKKSKGRGRDGMNRDMAEHTVNSQISKWELAAEMDMAANAEGQPAVAKLKLLHDLEGSLAHRELQSEYLDRGVLGVLKAWLEPLPDGNLPNVKVRSSVLRVLDMLPVDTALPDRRQQLKQSNIGKVVMFLYRLESETPGNRRAAKNLVERWSRPILREHRDELADNQMRLAQEREMASVRQRRIDAMKDEEKVAAAEQARQKQLKPGQTGFRYHARIPRAAQLDYVRQPESKVAADTAAKAKNATAAAMKKKILKLKNKNKNSTGNKVSVAGGKIGL